MYWMYRHLDDAKHFKAHKLETELVNFPRVWIPPPPRTGKFKPFCLSISLFTSTKDHEDSEMVPYLQTSKLAYHGSTDAGRK